MGAIFGGSKAPSESEESKRARERAEARAEAAEARESAALRARRGVRRTGGLRLLMSPARQEGPQQQQTKLGGGQ